MRSAFRRYSVFERRNTEKWLLMFVLFSVFLLPGLNPFPRWFEFRLEDLLLPLVMLTVIAGRKYSFDRYTLLVGIFAVYILFTIMINGRFQEVRDYFEIYKLIKYLFFFWFFMMAFSTGDVKPVLRFIFFLLILFNLLHYFNILDFNRFIEPLFASESRLLFFGKNSLGGPSTKRLMGTMGNPNNNAILFLFFTALFAPGKKSQRIDLVIFYLSFMAILLTQSRTGMVAFVIVTIANIFIQRFSYKTVFIQLFLFVLIFAAVNLIEYADLRLQKQPSEIDVKKFHDDRDRIGFEKFLPASEYLTNIIESDVSERSITGRLQAWKHLWGMIREKPVFGHSPYKEYFYENKIYPESEYILMTWRYGFIGLFLYLGLLVYPVIAGIRRKPVLKEYPSVLFLAVILITALMNTPLCEPRILLMVAFMNALIYRVDLTERKVHG